MILAENETLNMRESFKNYVLFSNFTIFWLQKYLQDLGSVVDLEDRNYI